MSLGSGCWGCSAACSGALRRWHLLACLLTSASTNGLLLKKQTAKKHTHTKIHHTVGYHFYKPHQRAVSLEFCSPASRQSPWSSAAWWRGFVLLVTERLFPCSSASCWVGMFLHFSPACYSKGMAPACFRDRPSGLGSSVPGRAEGRKPGQGGREG